MKINKPFLIVLLFYFLLTSLTLINWTKYNWFPMIGDEPHYLVMTSGLVNHGTLEQTLPYKEEFENRNFYILGLAPRGSTPSPSNTHAVNGPNGLYNLHNIGLPLLSALPFAVAGPTGVKFFLVFLSGLVVALCWVVAGIFTKDTQVKVMIVIATAFSVPLIPVSNQIYPDIPAGIIILGAIVWMLTRERQEKSRHGIDLIVAFAIAFLPWLHIKFSVAALLLAAGLSYFVFKSDRSLKKASTFIWVLLASGITMGFYNLYAFGQFSGPYFLKTGLGVYSSNPLVFNKTSLMALFGMHIDQSQGILLQNPAYFIGFLFIVPFIRYNWRIGTIILLTYLSILLPAAITRSWYGGSCFYGRYVWAGVVALMPFTILGLVKIYEHSKKSFNWITISFISFQFYMFIKYTTERFDFYNKQSFTWLNDYSSFYSPFEKFFPAFYNSEWAFTFGPNYAFTVFLAGLISFGVFFKQTDQKIWYKSLKLYLFTSFLFLFVVGLTSHPTYPIRIFHAADLPSHTGFVEIKTRERKAVVARNQEGFITHGPYIRLSEGHYGFRVYYNSPANSDKTVGWWDVFNPSSGFALSKGLLIGTSGKYSYVEGNFYVADIIENTRFEIRNYFSNMDNLTIKKITLFKRVSEKEYLPGSSGYFLGQQRIGALAQ